MARQKKAVTLVELMLIVLFIGIFAVVAIPRMNYSLISKHKADAFSRKIVTDLRRARSLAISDAADNTSGFALKMTGSSPYTGYEIKNLDTEEIVDSHVIASDVTCTGGDEFNFGPLGNLLSGSDTELTITSETNSFVITIISATGMVKCVEN